MKSLMIIFVVVLFLFAEKVTFGQTKPSNALLVKTIDTTVSDVGESVDNLSLKLRSTMNLDEDWIAIRVCSRLPLPIAINIVWGSPYEAALNMGLNGIPLKNIVFLRREKCVSSQSMSTEYWLVRKNGELPTFVESKKATNLLVEELIYSDTRLDILHNSYNKPRNSVNAENYTLILANVIDRLKTNKNSLVLISYPVNKTQKSLIMKNVILLKKMFKNEGINSNRIFTRMLSYFSKQSYPDIKIINEV